MPCNYLFRMENEEKYEHVIFPGCSNSRANSACINFFKKRNPRLSVTNFEKNKDQMCIHVWVKGIEGVAIVEEKFEIYVGEINVLKDQNLPPGPDNFIKGQGLLARSVELKPLKLLDLFKDDVS